MSEQYDLTQAGLEEYNTQNALFDQNNQSFNHHKQSSYAQSEGYHSYVSSSDSSSVTPFLDRLRLESSVLLQKTNQCQGNENCDYIDERRQSFCEENNSSTETLKWLGSVNDDSDSEYAVESAAVSEPVFPTELIADNHCVRTPKRVRSESTIGQIRNVEDSKRNSYFKLNCNELCLSDPSLCTGLDNKDTVFTSDQVNEQKNHNKRSLKNIHSYETDRSFKLASLTSNTQKFPVNSDKTQSNTITSTFHIKKVLNVSSENSIKSSASGNSNPALRTNFQIFPTNIYKDPLNKTVSNLVAPEMKSCCTGYLKQNRLNHIQPGEECISVQNHQCWQSVTDLISDFERTSNQPSHQYAFLEPSKTHRVSNPALKAIQKTAVQSYFERQQLQNIREQQKTIVDGDKPVLRPQSLHTPLNLANISVQVRNSLPENLNVPSKINLNEDPVRLQLSKNPLKMVNHSSNEPSPEPPPPPPRSRSLMPTFMKESSLENKNTNKIHKIVVLHEKFKENSKLVVESERMPYNISGIPIVPPPPPPRKATSSLEPYSLPLTSTCQTHYYNFCNTNSSNKYTNFWAPERPPKNPSLRIPSPELPPPPPEIDSNLSDEPLPPPPPEVLHTNNIHFKNDSIVRANSFTNNSSQNMLLSRSKSMTKKKVVTRTPPQIPKKPCVPKKVEIDSLYPNNRKRSHNTMQTSESTKIENSKGNTTVISSINKTGITKYAVMPPPLLPKNSVSSYIKDEINYNNRNNTKSSYLLKRDNTMFSYSDNGTYRLKSDISDKNLDMNERTNTEILGKSTTLNALPDILPQDAKQELNLCQSLQHVDISPITAKMENSIVHTIDASALNSTTLAMAYKDDKGNAKATKSSKILNDLYLNNFSCGNETNSASIENSLRKSLATSRLNEPESICTYISNNKLMNNLYGNEHKNCGKNFEMNESSSNEKTPENLDSSANANDNTQKMAALSICANEINECKETTTISLKESVKEQPSYVSLPTNEENTVMMMDYMHSIRELLYILPNQDVLKNILTPIKINTPNYTNDLYNADLTLHLKTFQYSISTSTENDKLVKQGCEFKYGEDLDEIDLIKQNLVKLITVTSCMLKELNREQSEINEEKAKNDILGKTLVQNIAEKLLPYEKTKLENYIDDIGHITSLLSALSERLAKTEFSLNVVANNNSEKAVINEKLDRIQDQLGEAKQLKDLINDRGIIVKNFLQRQLSERDFLDFNYFINKKAKLIIDVRRTAFNIKLKEEQLCALREALLRRS